MNYDLPNGHEPGRAPASNNGGPDIPESTSANFGNSGLTPEGSGISNIDGMSGSDGANSTSGEPPESGSHLTPVNAASPDHENRRHLRAAPEPGPANRRAPVARWVLSLSEPLLTTREREVIDEQMAAFIDRNAQWSAYWFAGFLFDIASSLPDDDPWRRLSASVDLGLLSLGHTSPDPDTRLVFANPTGAVPDSPTGAVDVDGVRFGRVGNASDLVMSEMGDPAMDIGLVAVAEPLHDLASAIVGFSFANAEFLAAALTKIYHALWMADFADHDGRTGGEGFLDEAGGALRWLIHRRRVYTGQDDPFPTVCGFAWMARADRLVAGSRRISAELGLAQDAKIDDGSYGDMRGL